MSKETVSGSGPQDTRSKSFSSFKDWRVGLVFPISYLDVNRDLYEYSFDEKEFEKNSQVHQ